MYNKKISKRYNEEIDDLKKRLNQAYERIEYLESDRAELYKRVDCIIRSYDERFNILCNNRDDLYQRVENALNILRRTGLTNVYSKIDSRISRLEIIQYYSDKDKYISLDEERRALLEELIDDYKYGRDEGRLFPEDEYYITDKINPSETIPFYESNGMYYTYIDNKKIYLGENEKDSRKYLEETIYWLEGDTPHRYLDKERDGIGFDKEEILLDIGAAEGYFGVKHYDECKKVYFFECDQYWLKYLKKTCESLPKAEIIDAYVGDGKNSIRLDEFFQDIKEKPTIIKIDAEGCEGAILRGLGEMLYNDQPLKLLICTYHRQEDWDRYYSMLEGRYKITHSEGLYWNVQDPAPPFFRRGVMRAEKIPSKTVSYRNL